MPTGYSDFSENTSKNVLKIFHNTIVKIYKKKTYLNLIECGITAKLTKTSYLDKFTMVKL